MTAPTVNRHWIVRQQSGGDVLDGSPFDTPDAAKAAARTAAAAAPAAVYVIYEAVNFAYTDLTPVNVLPVTAAVS
jgi:hypothetical protein